MRVDQSLQGMPRSLQQSEAPKAKLARGSLAGETTMCWCEMKLEQSMGGVEVRRGYQGGAGLGWPFSRPLRLTPLWSHQVLLAPGKRASCLGCCGCWLTQGELERRFA